MTVDADGLPLWRRRWARAGAALLAGMATGYAIGALARADGLVEGVLVTVLGRGAGGVMIGLLGNLSAAQEALLLGAAMVGALVPAMVMKVLGMTAADIFRDRWASGENVR